MVSLWPGKASPDHPRGARSGAFLPWVGGLLVLAALGDAIPGLGAQALKGSTPYKMSPTLAHPGCLSSCHTAHSMTMARQEQARSRKAVSVTEARMAPLDRICLDCHQGPRVKEDLGAAKLPDGAEALSRHILDPAKLKGLPYVRLLDRNRTRALGRRQVALRPDCSGCHDVHGKELGPMLSPYAFDAHGEPVGGRPVFAAQVCFGCHAGPSAAPLAQGEPDLGSLFSPEAASSHAIGRSAAGRHDLPSLRNGKSSRLDCTSCHGNPDPTGTPGPHFSTYPNLLKAPYRKEQDWSPGGGSNDNLCYLCHDQRSIEADESFPLHLEHITGFARVTGKAAARALGRFDSGIPLSSLARPGRVSTSQQGFGQATPCATCHDPHGSRQNAHLIAFDPAVVSPSSVGGVSYTRRGLGGGTCTLNCHGHDHVQTSY